MCVALLADFLEEGWPSMDLFAEMIFTHLPPALDETLPCSKVDLLRPAAKRRFSAFLPQRPGAGATAWNIDRLANRFFDYPRFLRSRRRSFDLFHLVDHSYAHLLHELPAGRAVVTCHDLDTFRCLWEPARERRGLAFRAMTRRILSGLQKAAHICCVSADTRDALLEKNLVPPERVSVIHPGMRPNFMAPPDPAAFATVDRLLNLNRPTAGTTDLLHVGSTIPRKRIDVLIDIFRRIKGEVEPRARLLQVGGDFTPAQHRQLERSGLRESVQVLPFLSAAELAAIYRRARLVLLPSEAEGFGLPVIEALACGTPILVSDIPSLREAGGAAASYAAIGDVDAWLKQARVLLNESPAQAEERREKARRQSDQFSWTRHATQLTAIYNEILARQPPVSVS